MAANQRQLLAEESEDPVVLIADVRTKIGVEMCCRLTERIK
jgi:hypothetical protein